VLTVLLGELARLLVGNLPLFGEVRLVPDEEDHRVVVRQVPCVRQPATQMVVRGPPTRERERESKVHWSEHFLFFFPLCNETLVPCDIVHHHSSSRSAVVASSDSPNRSQVEKYYTVVSERTKKRRKTIVPEALLTSSVPNLELDLLSTDLNDPGAELDSNCVRAIRHDFKKEKKKEENFFFRGS